MSFEGKNIIMEKIKEDNGHERGKIHNIKGKILYK
jgi:hypothetical protein